MKRTRYTSSMISLGRLRLATAFAVVSLGCAANPDSSGGRSGTPTSTTSSATSGTGGASTTSAAGGASSVTGTSSGGVAGAGTSGASGSSATTTSAGGNAGSGAGGASSGGSGGTGNVPEGGSSDGGEPPRPDGSAPGASGCVGVVSKFCDDFEQQTAGAAPTGDFTVGAKPGAIVVDSTKAYSGTKAIHLTTAKPGATTMLQFTKQFPFNDLHGRGMFFLTRIPTANPGTAIHWDIVYSYSQNNVQWEIGGMFGKFMFVVDPPDHALTSIVFPTGKWFCLQWEFKYGGTAGADNTFVAKMDSAVLDKGQFTGADPSGMKWNGGPWRSLNVGWTGYGSSDVDIEMWIDDLAFGDQPIACPALKN